MQAGGLQKRTEAVYREPRVDRFKGPKACTEFEMKKRILVVDDEEGLRLLYKEELEDEGYSVELAASGQEALDKIEKDSIDLVILDIKMPGMDGVEVLRKVKDRWKDLPVVLCTAYPHYKHEFGTWASDAYIVKSSDLTELKDTVKEILRDRS